MKLCVQSNRGVIKLNIPPTRAKCLDMLVGVLATLNYSALAAGKLYVRLVEFDKDAGLDCNYVRDEVKRLARENRCNFVTDTFLDTLEAVGNGKINPFFLICEDAVAQEALRIGMNPKVQAQLAAGIPLEVMVPAQNGNGYNKVLKVINGDNGDQLTKDDLRFNFENGSKISAEKAWERYQSHIRSRSDLAKARARANANANANGGWVVVGNRIKILPGLTKHLWSQDDLKKMLKALKAA